MCNEYYCKSLLIYRTVEDAMDCPYGKDGFLGVKKCRGSSDGLCSVMLREAECVSEERKARGFYLSLVEHPVGKD